MKKISGWMKAHDYGLNLAFLVVAYIAVATINFRVEVNRWNMSWFGICSALYGYAIASQTYIQSLRRDRETTNKLLSALTVCPQCGIEKAFGITTVKPKDDDPPLKH